MEGREWWRKEESPGYRSMGASVIGMTNMPEAKLAREARFKSPPVGGSKYNISYVLHLASPDAVTQQGRMKSSLRTLALPVHPQQILRLVVMKIQIAFVCMMQSLTDTACQMYVGGCDQQIARALFD